MGLPVDEGRSGCRVLCWKVVWPGALLEGGVGRCVLTTSEWTSGPPWTDKVSPSPGRYPNRFPGPSGALTISLGLMMTLRPISNKIPKKIFLAK